MKIGIITFHSAHNYGAVLQAYALCRKLNSMGYEVEIIDYRPAFIRKLYSINLLNKLSDFKGFISLVLMYPMRFSRYCKFERFIEHNMKLTENRYFTCIELKQKPPIMDAYITGSDQVWNPEINGVMDEYYLSFVKDFNAKKISYAASFGVDHIKDCYKYDISRKLRYIKSLSVREEDGINIVKNLIDKVPELVLDPVFLLNRHDWHKIVILPKLNYKYVLVYMMEYNERLIELANKIASEKKIRIINISNSIKVPKGFYKNVRNAGPREFLGFISTADYVITNSFHGTAFSIIFQKNFFVVPHTRLNSRIDNILKLLNLEDRQVMNIKKDFINIIKDLKIDYTNVKKRLETEIGLSEKYLLEALH